MLSIGSPSSREPPPTGIAEDESSTSSLVPASPGRPFTRTAHRATAPSNPLQRGGRADVLRRIAPFGGAEEVEELVGRLHARADQLLRAREVAEVADPNAAASVLILVGRADAAPRRADLLALLARPVEQLVVGQREV